MQGNAQRPKGRDGVLSTLNVTIEVLNLAKEICSIAQAKAAFGSVSVLLAMIKVWFLPSFDHGLPVHVSPGFDDKQRRLRRTRLILRRGL